MFQILNRYFPKTLVKTKKVNQITDLYAIIQIDYIENNIIYCKVCQYLDNTLFIIPAAMAHWFISKKYIPSIIDLTPSRLDLTHLDVYSIDPFGCRDIDDALSFDNNIIGIHIADVSSYIEEGGLLDNELSNRVETFYDIQKTIHMIPEELSNAIICR